MPAAPAEPDRVLVHAEAGHVLVDQRLVGRDGLVERLCALAVILPRRVDRRSVALVDAAEGGVATSGDVAAGGPESSGKVIAGLAIVLVEALHALVEAGPDQRVSLAARRPIDVLQLAELCLELAGAPDRGVATRFAAEN